MGKISNTREAELPSTNIIGKKLQECMLSNPSSPSSQTIHCCPYSGCRAKYYRPYRLKAHINSQHETSRQFACQHADCDKAFFRQEHLKRHLLRSHIVTNEGSLNISDQIYTKNSLHICEHCSKQFTYRQNLKRHIVEIHTDAIAINSAENLSTCSKPIRSRASTYGCQYCESTFRKKEALKKHLWAVHNQDKPYACEACANSFMSKQQLERHQARAHNNGASFTCDAPSCESSTLSFKSRRLLNQHVKIAHGALLRCDLCLKTFVTKRGLNRHLRRTQADPASAEAHALAATQAKRVQTYACQNAGCSKYYLHQRNLTQHSKKCDTSIDPKPDS